MPFSVMGTIVGGEHTLNQGVAHNIQFAQFNNSPLCTSVIRWTTLGTLFFTL